MEVSEKIVFRAAQISFFVSVAVLLIKIFAYFKTGSTAVLSDALESIVNVVASFVALLVTKAVQEPADEEHPYGHGKLEYFSSAFEGGLVAFAAIAIGFSAVRALFLSSQLSQLDVGLVIMVVAGLINLALGFYLRTIGRKHHSAALQASGAHVLSDVWSTVAVVTGLLLVKLTGWNWLDPVVAIVVAGLLLRQGYSIARESVGGLIDEMEPEALTQISRSFEDCRIAGIIDIHNLKIIRSGRFHHIDAHVVVPEFWDVLTAHNNTEEFEKAIIHKYPYEGEIAFHVDPCHKQYCRSCEIEECPIRVSPFEKRRDFMASQLIKGPVVDYV
jgi:cation diffusion facilitator family transporter